MPLPLTVSCFSKIQIGFAFLVPAHPGSPGQRAVKRVCVCVCYAIMAARQNNIFYFASAVIAIDQLRGVDSVCLHPELCISIHTHACRYIH